MKRIDGLVYADSITCDIASHVIEHVCTLTSVLLRRRRIFLYDIRNGRRLDRYPKHMHILRINVLSTMS